MSSNFRKCIGLPFFILNILTLISFFDSLWIRTEILNKILINKHTLKYLKNLN